MHTLRAKSGHTRGGHGEQPSPATPPTTHAKSGAIITSPEKVGPSGQIKSKLHRRSVSSAQMGPPMCHVPSIAAKRTPPRVRWRCRHKTSSLTSLQQICSEKISGSSNAYQSLDCFRVNGHSTVSSNEEYHSHREHIKNFFDWRCLKIK